MSARIRMAFRDGQGHEFEVRRGSSGYAMACSCDLESGPYRTEGEAWEAGKRHVDNPHVWGV